MQQVTISRELAEEIVQWLDVLADSHPDPRILATTCALIYRIEQHSQRRIPEHSGNLADPAK